jgi:molecular chaperone HtpG
MSIESREFHAQTNKLLELMIHSVYSEKEVFLRELISNASDAIDKVRFLAQTDEALAVGDHDYKIKLFPDATAGTLKIVDNGIGMDFDEVVNNLGTIARSGTEAFLAEMAKAGSEGATPDLIGRFGLGFYSAFMVADNVVVETYKTGEENAVRWTSSGDGTYTVERLDPMARGTSITLELKPAPEDTEETEAVQSFDDTWALKSIIKKHSDFVRWPIVMDMERTEYPDKADGEGKDFEAEPKKFIEEETLNSQTALWTRAKDEISDEEYEAFYKTLSHDWNPPAAQLHFTVEGMRAYTALMYLPEKAPADLYTRESRRGLSLFVKNIFIMEDCKELMPEYLRFIRGLVDSPDLPLNVSREMVQQDRVIAAMRKMLTKKWLAHFATMLADDRASYETVWTEFGAAIKEGFHYEPKNQDKLAKLSMWQSTNGTAWTTLDEVVGRMKEGQDSIYVLLGNKLETLREAPQLEVFEKKGIEVLLLSDHVDEFVLGALTEFDGKKLVDISRGEVDLSAIEGEEAEAEEAVSARQEAYAPLCDLLSTGLEAQIDSVRVSTRLTDSAVCLVTPENAPSPQMERMMRSMGQEMPPVKRTLELNPDHALIQKLQAIHAENAEDDRLEEFGELLYAQALLSEGGQLDNPARFAKRMATVMARAI